MDVRKYLEENGSQAVTENLTLYLGADGGFNLFDASTRSNFSLPNNRTTDRVVNAIAEMVAKDALALYERLEKK